MAAQPDIQILTQVMDTFDIVFGTGRETLLPWSLKIALSLAIIEVTLLGAFHALKGGEESFIPPLIKKTLTIGFFVFLVTGIAKGGLADVILKGFIAVGIKASNTTMSFSMKDPSGIIIAGFQAAEPIIQAMSDMDKLAIGDRIIAFICYMGVLAGYFIMAFQVLITFIEWGIVSTLGIILLPFGISKHTAFLSEKAIGAIIAFGVKLMVLAFVIGVIQPIIFTMPPLGHDPTWEQMIGLFITTLAIGLIVSQAPGVASAILSGAPALTSSVATAGAFGAAAAGVGTVMAGGAATGSAATAGAAALSGVAQAAGAISGFKSAAQSEAGQAVKASTTGLAAGAVGSALKGAMGGNAFSVGQGKAAASGMGQVIQQQVSSKQATPATEESANGGGSEATSSLKDSNSSHTGGETKTGAGSGANGSATTKDAGSNAGNTAESTTGGESSTKDKSADGQGGSEKVSSFQSSRQPTDGGTSSRGHSSLRDALTKSKQGIPQDATPSAGADVRIHHD